MKERAMPYLSAIVLGLLAISSHAATTSAERVGVVLIASRTFAGAPTRDSDTIGSTLAIGEQSSMYFLTDASQCTEQVGSVRPSTSMIARAANLWTAKTRVLSATADA